MVLLPVRDGLLNLLLFLINANLPSVTAPLLDPAHEASSLFTAIIVPNLSQASTSTAVPVMMATSTYAQPVSKTAFSVVERIIG